MNPMITMLALAAHRRERAVPVQLGGETSRRGGRQVNASPFCQSTRTPTPVPATCAGHR